MSDPVRAPRPAPCGSCPYRRDVPSGVWAEEEYEILPRYDAETFDQPPAVFMCHQQDGHLCAGWVGCHDMEESMGLRLLARMGERISDDDLEATYAYVSPVPLFASGTEAASHGLAEVEEPSPRAGRVIQKLRRDRGLEDSP